jgi:DinB superfamily
VLHYLLVFAQTLILPLCPCRTFPGYYPVLVTNNQKGNRFNRMKKLLLVMSLALGLVSTLQAQDLTQEERNQAVKYLEKTRDGVFKATKSLSEAQWNFKPAPDRWSVAEVTEHIAAAEDYLMDHIRKNVLKAPARTEPADLKAIDALVLQQIPDRSHKVEAPEPLRPSNRFGSPKDSLKHFRESRDKTIAFLKKTEDLRQHAVDSPVGKKLDGYQWVLFIAAHSERHTKQINEVMADPNFPKK